jgi:NAD(P)-dependent dehydrogenase (short-subunit alcohol dehydrogenase family)
MTSGKWTAADIPPQAGRLAIVTGGTSGIGYETALALAKAGARVVIAARNEKRGADAIASIRRRNPTADVEFRPLDTARLSSVRKFAEDWQREQRGIDILVLNAGIAAVPNREETEDGFERQLATNYLGHFALAGLLLPYVAASPASRIVAVASIAHRHARLHFDDLQLKRNYHSGEAYNQSKLAILMFGLDLDRRLRAAGSPIQSIPAHPGMAVTDIFRRGDRAGPVQQIFAKAIFRVVGQSAAMGALPILYAATSPDARGGAYYGPDSAREIRGYPRGARIEPHALDREAATRLWDISEELTGVRYRFS